MKLERFVGLGIVNGLTISRPILGKEALQATKRDDWQTAGIYFTAAFATDLDGKVARFINATSKFGAYADVLSDALLRIQMMRALAPAANKAILGSTITLEMDIARMNRKIQKGRAVPIIPYGAKVGTALQGVGVITFCEGMHTSDSLLRSEGELAILGGSILRNTSYRTLYKRTGSVR